jgi:tetratricopeptide (TPR) repeat protein
MFSEFKEDVEETAGEAEDPDNHYNLGVAFKEMGLLDEAIGELQKVCQAVDKGVPFSQAVQAYTWLAHCFQEKGVPQAAIKWYEKALNPPITGRRQAVRVHDLAAAHEAAGNTKAALDNFMEVYGTNIDYRDVADRIKALKS